MERREDMWEIPRAKVANQGEGWLGTEYYINNQKIDRVKSVDFRVAVDEVPTFDFEMQGMPDIDMLGEVRFSFAPETVHDAFVVLRNELMKHGDVYKAFLSSIESSVKEQGGITGAKNGQEREAAKEILKRIIGDGD